MSYVTEVVIIAAVPQDKAIEFIDRQVEKRHGPYAGVLGQVNTTSEFGGPNCVSCEVYGAGYDYLDEALFMEAVKAAPWQDPKSVIVWIRPEAAATPDVWNPVHGQLAQAEPLI